MAFQHLAQDFSPAHSLFRRCVQCPPNVAPTCPVCKSDEICSQTLGDCDHCPSASCVKAVTSGSIPINNGGNDKGPNIGAIVGGVIGGVAFIAIAVFCIWKFYLKGRRHEVELEEDWEDDYPAEKSNAGSVFTRDARSRASTHTVASMASTVLTRASNIIQIAFIPGVTNRSGGSDPNLLVPPVPPIPSAVGTPSSTSSRFDDDIMFSARDIRDSTYSDMTTFDQRRPGSIAPSLARSSIATTIYRDSAIVDPMPATQVIGGKAAVVSVVGGKGSAPSTPPVPQIDYRKVGGKAVKPVLVKMPGSGDSGSGSATSSLKTMKPVALTIIRKDKKGADSASIVSSGLTRVPSSPASTVPTMADRKSKASNNRLTSNSLAPSELSVDTHRRARQSGMTHRSSRMTNYTDEDSDEDDHERSRQSLLDRSASPFTDAAAVKTPTTPTGTADALKVDISPADIERGKSPFEDPEPSPKHEKKA